MQATTTDIFPSERHYLVNLLRRWGGASTDAVLDPVCQSFYAPNIEGVIGYRVEFGCALVYGDPVCNPDDAPALASAFHRFCEDNNLSIIFLAASKRFAKWAIKNICKSSVEFGNELFLDPQIDPEKRTGTHASLVRRKVKHALKNDVIVHEHLSYDASIEQAIDQVGATWLQGRRGPQIHISNVRLFDDREGKRWFYAQQGDAIVGVIVVNHLQSKEGWLLNHLMITPQAPGGTSELLVVKAIQTLGRENCRYATFGSVLGEDIGEIEGFGRVSSWMAHRIVKLTNRLFHLSGRRTFWEKFHPTSESSYILFSNKSVSIKNLLCLQRALNIKLSPFSRFFCK